MQVIGLCRFSYPGIGGFQVGHEDIDAKIAYLYSDARLEERFRFFECFTLPSIQAQTDQDFTFLIVIGDSLPAHHRARLEALVSDTPQVVIQTHPPGPHRAIMKKAINAVRSFNRQPCLQFRLDDDDAVGVRFVEELRAAARHVRSLNRESVTIAIDFNTGFIAKPGARGIEVCEVKQSYWTPALAIMFSRTNTNTIMSFSHNKVWQRMPTLTLPKDDMLLRGHNAFNDSRQGPNVQKPELTLLDAEGEERFRKSYNINADQVRAVFA